MASPPIRDELAGNPTNAEFKLGIGKLWDYVTGLLGNTATVALDTEKKLARESLGVGSFGFKSKFINPEFSISQESGASAVTVVAGGAIKYIVDQWYAIALGANISGQRIAGISDKKYSLRLTGASGNTAATIGQRMESLNCVDLKNQTVAVSFNAKSSGNRTITWTAFYANSENVFSSKTSIASGTLAITTTLDRYTFVFNAGVNAGNGIAIELAIGALGSTETIDFDQAQFEKSAVKTEFEVRSVQQEILLCQRYYEKSYVLISGYHTAGNAIGHYISYKVNKITAPTITVSGVGTSNVASYNFTFVSESGMFLSLILAAIGATSYGSDWVANARL